MAVLSDKKMAKLKKLNLIVNNIMEASFSWDEKFDLIFSDKVSGKVSKIYHFSYYDPDTSYEEDVRAYVDAFNEEYKRLTRDNYAGN